MHLDGLITGQIGRNAKYHGAADEWPMGHTPTELKEKLEAELKAWDEIAGVTSDDESDNDDSKHRGGNGIGNTVGRGETVAAPDRPQRPRRPQRSQRSQQVEGLLTPSLSAESPPSPPQRRKRRMVSEEDDTEKEYPAKKQVSSAKEVSADTEDAVLNTPQQKSRKRRRNIDMDDGEEVAKERPSKARVTTARPSRIWMQRLRPRPITPAG